MFENDTAFILVNIQPHSWTDEDADRIKQLFCRQRPVVPVALARALYRYWRRRGLEELLFEDAEDNVALLLHARAYGERIPEPGDSSFLGKFLKEHSDLFAPLMPPRQTWGPRAVLAREVLAGLDSPVMHAWVFFEGTTLQEILIVGEGLPEIRQQVISAAFMASLQVYGVADDVMNIGLLRINLPGHLPITPLDIPFNIIGDQRNPLAPEDVETAMGTLQELLAYLKKLERDTGLLQVHQVTVTDQKAFIDTFKAYAREASSDPNSAILLKNDDEEVGVDIVTLIPYWQIGGDMTMLNLTLSADLIQTLDFEGLQKAHQYATIERGLIDLGTRRDYYQRKADHLEKEKRRFEQATPEQRRAIWGRTTLLGERFDFELGVSIKLPRREEAPTELFFEKNIPGQIMHFRVWQKRIQHIIDRVQKSYERPDTPVRRFAVSRFLDAAIRKRHPDESRAVLVAFEAWSTEVQPLLWFEWRCLLQQKGIKPERVFTPHTFFHTWLSPTRDRLDVARLVVSPFTLVDQRHSVTLFDSERRVIIVHDATDYAEPFSVIAQTLDERWQRLMILAEQSDITTEKFAGALREELRQAPSDIIKRILEAFIENHEVKRPNSSTERVDMEANLVVAVQKMEVSRLIGQAVVALSVMAFQTARRSLDVLRGYPEWRARVCLLRAILECLAYSQPFQEILPAIFHDVSRSAHRDIRTALEQAGAADHQYVEKWIEAVETNPETAIGQLLRGLPLPEQELQPEEYAALLARGAIESARLARELEKAARNLAEEREIVTTAFAKLGWALEKVLLANFTSGPQDELIDLIAILTGQKSLEYPTTGDRTHER
jgi:hypothetical protein